MQPAFQFQKTSLNKSYRKKTNPSPVKDWRAISRFDIDYKFFDHNFKQTETYTQLYHIPRATMVDRTTNWTLVLENQVQ